MDAMMVATDMLGAMAEALLGRDALRLRLLVQAWQRTHTSVQGLARPTTEDPRILATAAALAELLALQNGEPPPSWTRAIGALPAPFFAVAWAERPGFTRNLCFTESPEPFRRHNIFAPPNFLHMV